MSATETNAAEILFADVLEMWESRRPDPGLLPPRRAFDMTDFMHWIGWVSIYDIEPGDPIRFRMRMVGTQVVIIDQKDNTGRYLDEVFPPAEFPFVFKPYFEALEKRAPVYLQRTVPTVTGLPKTLSKLVLPVSDDGHVPNKVINVLHYSDLSDLRDVDLPLVI